MSIRIEDVRKYLSNIANWLTFDDDTRFLKDERNEPTTENGLGLTMELDIYTLKSRKLFNVFSESLEDLAIYRKKARNAIEREKEMRRNMNMGSK